ncbi:hypothetical protein ASPZODRAFT_28541 [Penicilliopsis zonata CBS 506.65]|uniref:Uncharacterized protein n=1 Tax=Penicilliopsis zonata CBS 506.65 TaxID=1073090 RepID=A0A1L9S7U8_9EURO|nr:hypothetical protein ASPZODRAFT_28541 [Penicilliopsis zonata CBS 506.65]OJJ43229.1 hypothetical protein ASPZODRAFT_28541 [Penicilliopsis zonata CBS 506.65]
MRTRGMWQKQVSHGKIIADPPTISVEDFHFWEPVVGPPPPAGLKAMNASHSSNRCSLKTRTTGSSPLLRTVGQNARASSLRFVLVGPSPAIIETARQSSRVARSYAAVDRWIVDMGSTIAVPSLGHDCSSSSSLAPEPCIDVRTAVGGLGS